MAKNPDPPVKGDHLKYYCIVFGILVVVIAFVAIQQNKKLNAYRKANVFAEKLLTGKGLPATTTDGRPNRMRDLAVEVEKFVQGYRKSMGDEAGGGSSEGISNAKMQRAALAVHMNQLNASAGRPDDNRGKGFRTHWREFTYAPCSLDALWKLVRNIESWGRYRVFEIRWKLREPKANSKPPFNLIQKPVIKVGYRTPLRREQG